MNQPADRVWRTLWGMMCALGIFVFSTGVMGQEEQAKTGVEELCAFGPPASSSEEVGRAEYHRRRRELVYQVHEAELREVDPSSMDYDHVTGLLTISGFREYRLPGTGMTLAFRNGCILQFEYDEAEAHDVMTKMAMGTIRLEVGFLVGAFEDFDADYCPIQEDGRRQLEGELLFGRLIDRDAPEEERVVGRYQTPEGLQWALRLSTLSAGANRLAVPEVEISDFRWLPYEEHDDVDARRAELRESLEEGLEEALFSCYFETLRRNPSTQGALVIETGFEESMSVLLDTIDEAPLVECIRQEVPEVLKIVAADGMQWPGERFKVTILMRRR